MAIYTLSANTVEFAKAVADKTRQQIRQMCCCKWCSVTDLIEATKVSQLTVTHHLTIFKQAGLLKNGEMVGKKIMYSLNQKEVALCCGQMMGVLAPEIKTHA